MNKEKKRRIKNILIFALTTLLLVVGISYAYINFSVEGTKANLIKAGCLKFSFAETTGLSLGNSAPMADKTGLASSPYTFTITNTCSSEAYYTTTFNILDDSNTDNISKVKVALGGDSNVLPTLITDLEQVELQETPTNVIETYLLDTGYLAVDEAKTFDLRMWIDYDVTSFEGLFNSKIIIEAIAKEGPSYSSATSGYQVLENNDIIDSPIKANNLAPSENQPSGLYKYDDNTYLFRGATENNYLRFAKYSEDEEITYINSEGATSTIEHTKDDDIIWRIVRVNEDGSVTIVLNDLVGTSAFATSASSSTSNIYGDSTNNMKTSIDEWYEKHLEPYEKYIIDRNFCVDKTSYENNGVTYYNGYKRNVTNVTPTYSCSSENSYSVANGKLTYPIGMLTADELALAGAKYSIDNTEYYLYNGTNGFYTLTPAYYDGNGTTIFASTPSTNSAMSVIPVTTELTIRPVITLSSDVILSGNGTINNKYIVEGLYSEGINVVDDNNKPTIVSASASTDWSQNLKSITIRARDDEKGRGIAGYYISTSSTTPDINDANWIESTEKLYVTEEIYDNGRYYIWVKDKSGNISSSTTVTVTKVDLNNPTCTIAIIKSESSYKTLEITGIDEDSSIKDITSENKELTLENNKVNDNIRDNGVYAYNVYDSAGRSGSCEIVITSIDTEPPVVDDITKSCTGNSCVLTTNMTDNAGVKYTAVTTSANLPADDAWTTLDTAATIHAYEDTIDEEGTYYLWAKDEAGNYSSNNITLRTNYTYSCNTGDSLSGTTCTNTATNTYNASVSYSCNSGDTRSGTTCTNIKYTSATPKYSCSSGYTLSGTTCKKTTTVAATKGGCKTTNYTNCLVQYCYCQNSTGTTYAESYIIPTCPTTLSNYGSTCSNYCKNIDGYYGGYENYSKVTSSNLYCGTYSGCTCTEYNYYCSDSSYTLSGTTCSKTTSKAANVSYSCSSGTIYNTSQCKITSTYTATTNYSCNSGDTRSGATCTHKTVTTYNANVVTNLY